MQKHDILQGTYIILGMFWLLISSSFMENEDELQLMGWNLTPEDLTHIPEHWLSYPEVRSLYHYILAFSYTILFCLGVIGNGLVLWIFCV